ncbi:KLTH0E15532p [Lachancea thermotolerans CBS 6340]|uniref:KLTH0E15532p n=1 Tax=Lachancea thermotolerans (strain ATCC 56472 / CBS 6340 / NRRL Y-8284) TaxID=559295 RepID=C5DIV7_LACTC|nr:KLTH0E15532p [Lachancea thermotolerans CBS 6340]CAR23718.1 KLTH0E15532p [Lachancea thermotolerans CBS 6340]
MSGPTNSSAVGKLRTGATIPLLGFGTWRSTEEDGYNAVLTALKVGYRHIDTAAVYGNEAAVGRAIRDSGVPRDQLFVTTKLWNTQHRDPRLALDQSLQRLGLDYVDLYLIHWPLPLRTQRITDGNLFTVPTKEDGKPDVDEQWSYVKTWEMMQDLPDTSKTRAVGVSNFSVTQLQNLLAASGTKVIPAVNQVETHPLLPQDKLYKFCSENNILLEAYSPLGSQGSPLVEEPAVKEIASKHNADPAQVLISWGIKRGYVILPKSVTPSRIESNFKIVDLTDDDFAKINNIHKEKGEKRINDPDWFHFDEN